MSIATPASVKSFVAVLRGDNVALILTVVGVRLFHGFLHGHIEAMTFTS